MEYVQNNMEYIESYFKGNNSGDDKQQFERRIAEDSTFAGEVAFYVSDNGVIQQQLQEEKKQRFREMLKRQYLADAKKYAGIVSLRLQNYDKALGHFTMLETDTSIYINASKFYKAITLLKRNKNGEKEKVKLLSQEVIAKDMEGKD